MPTITHLMKDPTTGHLLKDPTTGHLLKNSVYVPPTLGMLNCFADVTIVSDTVDGFERTVEYLFTFYDCAMTLSGTTYTALFSNAELNGNTESATLVQSSFDPYEGAGVHPRLKLFLGDQLVADRNQIFRSGTGFPYTWTLYSEQGSFSNVCYNHGAKTQANAAGSYSSVYPGVATTPITVVIP